MLEQVAKRIADETSLTIGSNLYISTLPDTPSDCFAIYQNVGSPRVEVFDATGDEDLRRPSLQVLGRGVIGGYAALLINMSTVVGAATVSNLLLTSVSGEKVFFYSAVPTGSPTYLGVDEKNRPQFVQNLDCVVGKEYT